MCFAIVIPAKCWCKHDWEHWTQPKCLGVCFYLQLTQQHREFYRDKSGMLYVLPYFVLPSKEKERYPHPLDL